MDIIGGRIGIIGYIRDGIAGLLGGKQPPAKQAAAAPMNTLGFEAEVLDVLPHATPSASLRYLRDDGGIGSVMAEESGYGAGYWPPCRGDIIRVTPAAVTLRARPRRPIDASDKSP